MRIFERLQLSDTFVFDHTLKQSDSLPLYNKNYRLNIPLVMSSMASDGSTGIAVAHELLYRETSRL